MKTAEIELLYLEEIFRGLKLLEKTLFISIIKNDLNEILKGNSNWTKIIFTSEKENLSYLFTKNFRSSVHPQKSNDKD
ncbi:hypothetical protein BpHYR1_014857 [Brachionus plicatilis]|uniref:Uncharacterized protein n=1 Tax=Brachionus plicatilis TaxID=10195 RepID=A0A3M7RYM7_BRAPC|nr:hypothetical protein BpHYR1_014857 [Brachionus plicatilis]